MWEYGSTWDHVLGIELMENITSPRDRVIEWPVYIEVFLTVQKVRNGRLVRDVLYNGQQIRISPAHFVPALSKYIAIWDRID